MHYFGVLFVVHTFPFTPISFLRLLKIFLLAKGLMYKYNQVPMILLNAILGQRILPSSQATFFRRSEKSYCHVCSFTTPIHILLFLYSPFLVPRVGFCVIVAF